MPSSLEPATVFPTAISSSAGKETILRLPLMLTIAPSASMARTIPTQGASGHSSRGAKPANW